MSGPDAVQLAYPELTGYISAARENILALPACAACGQWNWPPRAHCRTCGSARLHYRPVRSAGTVYSWAVSRRQGPWAPDSVTALVSVDDAPGVRVLGWLRARPGDTRLAVGARVRGQFVEAHVDFPLIQWSFA